MKMDKKLSASGGGASLSDPQLCPCTPVYAGAPRAFHVPPPLPFGKSATEQHLQVTSRYLGAFIGGLIGKLLYIII